MSEKSEALALTDETYAPPVRVCFGMVVSELTEKPDARSGMVLRAEPHELKFWPLLLSGDGQYFVNDKAEPVVTTSEIQVLDEWDLATILLAMSRLWTHRGQVSEKHRREITALIARDYAGDHVLYEAIVAL